MRFLHLAAAAAAAVGASAQVPNDFRATYYSTADCSAGGSSSSVLAQQQYCQQMGGASAAYEVWCSDDGANGTLVSWDADGACAGAATAFRPFTSGQCLDSAGGSASVRYECLREPSTAPPALACGRCLVSWFEEEGCGGADRSVVDVPAGACQQDQQRSWLAGLEGGTQGSASRISFFRDSFCGAVDSSNMLAPAACAANPGMAAASFSVSCADACAPLVGGENVGENGGENEPAMTPNDFVATYFASSACDVSVGQQHSVVLAQQQFCQLGDGGRSSYQVWCADDGLNGTLVSFADGSCSGAFATTPFLSNQCLAAGNGASAVSFQCRVDAMTAPPALSCGRCQVSWFEVAGCTGNDRAIVDATAGLCQQDGSRSWMIGRDPNSGFAQVAFFDDAFCAINDVTTTLSSDDCAATPEAAESISGLGSRSMSAACAADCFPLPLPLPPVVATPQASRAPHAVYTPAAAPSLAAQAPTVAYASASRMAAPPAAPSLAAQAPTQAYPSASPMAAPPAAPSLAAQAPTVAYASASPVSAPPAAAPTLAAAQPQSYAASHSPTVVVAAPPPSPYHAAAPSASPAVVAAPPAHVYSTPAAAPSLAAQAPHAYAPSASPAAVVAAPPRPSAYHTAAPPVGAPASPPSAPPTMRPAPGGYNMPPPPVGAPAPYRQPYNAMPPPPPVQAAPAPSTYAPFAYRRPYYAPQVILFDNDDDDRGFHRGRGHGGFGSWRRGSHSHRRHHDRHHHH